MKSMGVRTRPVLRSDFEWLLELRLDTMSEHLEASGYVLSHDEQADRLQQQYSAINIIQLDGRDVGTIKAVREPDVWQLIQLQIAPEHQRKGIGAIVIEALLGEAREGSVPVSLHVLKVNPAKQLYERLGFEVVEDLGHSLEMRSSA